MRPLSLLLLPVAVSAALLFALSPGAALARAGAALGTCPEFMVPPVAVQTICTPQEFEEHTFIDAVVTNVSASPIAGYGMVVALYDASGTLLVSHRVERKARKGFLAPGESQDERFIAVGVPPAHVARMEITPLPR
ncbi:hypothetical protein [Megalodesulfovibrio gigas]|uniref:PrcB C-terminal domain-containing protein n=1 Tax=Megalodesulfovibrio gigas (strain ATCC 19364 / DSM 1382 / NCIMB 9332 / VKM B-1759) TaxID=1121448 RepID=T2GEL8_MEGG1|nr:hypothetical protein [Megalodesulfovibrio gigas]AGW14733.1 hypothetical protein DGI_3011 [Megalodesulfovibrio gigas DSM 1382 = ATCC 19364]